ncbi:MAG: ComEC/Rec2 family competence protein, partial [Ruminococcus sp.]|nr:ComEC/Rec2 family competence protein [Ruminococcus sp.]
DDYEYYDNVRVTGKVVRIKDNYNFQSEKYYFSQGVFLKGEGTASVTHLGTNSGGFFKTIREYSDRIFATVTQNSGYEEGGFLGAMLCGDKSEMDPAQKSMLYRSGIGHIFAVSGTHLVILASVISFLLERLLRRKSICAVVMIPVCWAFVIFAGMSTSVVRSVIMMTIVFTAQAVRRRGDCANSLGIAGIILCIANPYIVFSQGFQLSFASAFAAGAVAPFVYSRLNIRSVPRIFVKGFVFSCVESVFIAPLCLIHFGGFSLLSPITNALLIPVCTAALFLCFVVALTGGALFIAKPLLWLASKLVSFVLYAVKVISRPSLLFVTGSDILLLLIVSAVCIAVIIAACKSKRVVVTASVTAAGMLACMLCSNISTLLSSGRLQFFIFANKNNCAAVVINSDRAVLFDLSNGANYTGAQMRVMQACGVRTTSAVFVNREPYYTIGKYKDKIYPQANVYITGTEDPMDMQDVYEVYDGGSVQLDDMRITRLENGFAVEYNNETYSLYPDYFSVGDERYDTNGVSVRFSTDDKTVRRLDYELGLTNYAW